MAYLPRGRNNTIYAGHSSDSYTAIDTSGPAYDDIVEQYFSHDRRILFLPHCHPPESGISYNPKEIQGGDCASYISDSPIASIVPKQSMSVSQGSAETLKQHPSKQKSQSSPQKKESVSQEASARNLELMKIISDRISKVRANFQMEGIHYYSHYIPLTYTFKLFIVFCHICEDIKKIKNIWEIGNLSKEEIGHCRSDILELKREMLKIHESTIVEWGELRPFRRHNCKKILKICFLPENESCEVEAYIHKLDKKIGKTINEIIHFDNCLGQIQCRKTDEKIKKCNLSKTSLVNLLEEVKKDSNKLSKLKKLHV